MSRPENNPPIRVVDSVDEQPDFDSHPNEVPRMFVTTPDISEEEEKISDDGIETVKLFLKKKITALIFLIHKDSEIPNANDIVKPFISELEEGKKLSDQDVFKGEEFIPKTEMVLNNLKNASIQFKTIDISSIFDFTHLIKLEKFTGSENTLKKICRKRSLNKISDYFKYLLYYLYNYKFIDYFNEKDKENYSIDLEDIVDDDLYDDDDDDDDDDDYYDDTEEEEKEEEEDVVENTENQNQEMSYSVSYTDDNWKSTYVPGQGWQQGVWQNKLEGTDDWRNKKEYSGDSVPKSNSYAELSDVHPRQQNKFQKPGEWRNGNGYAGFYASWKSEGPHGWQNFLDRKKLNRKLRDEREERKAKREKKRRLKREEIERRREVRMKEREAEMNAEKTGLPLDKDQKIKVPCKLLLMACLTSLFLEPANGLVSMSSNTLKALFKIIGDSENKDGRCAMNSLFMAIQIKDQVQAKDIAKEIVNRYQERAAQKEALGHKPLFFMYKNGYYAKALGFIGTDFNKLSSLKGKIQIIDNNDDLEQWQKQWKEYFKKLDTLEKAYEEAVCPKFTKGTNLTKKEIDNFQEKLDACNGRKMAIKANLDEWKGKENAIKMKVRTDLSSLANDLFTKLGNKLIQIRGTTSGGKISVLQSFMGYNIKYLNGTEIATAPLGHALNVGVVFIDGTAHPYLIDGNYLAKQFTTTNTKEAHIFCSDQACEKYFKSLYIGKKIAVVGEGDNVFHAYFKQVIDGKTYIPDMGWFPSINFENVTESNVDILHDSSLSLYNVTLASIVENSFNGIYNATAQAADMTPEQKKLNKENAAKGYFEINENDKAVFRDIVGDGDVNFASVEEIERQLEASQNKLEEDIDDIPEQTQKEIDENVGISDRNYGPDHPRIRHPPPKDRLSSFNSDTFVGLSSHLIGPSSGLRAIAPPNPLGAIAPPPGRGGKINKQNLRKTKKRNLIKTKKTNKTRKIKKIKRNNKTRKTNRKNKKNSTKKIRRI